MVIWLDDPARAKELVQSTIPRTDHPHNKDFANYVRTYNIHKCVKERCFKTARGKRLITCKYGFPAPLISEIKLDEMKIRYQYPRETDEDRSVVPYNLETIMFWSAHCNLILVSDCAFFMYMLKYVTKQELTDEITITDTNKQKSNPEKYLKGRLCGSVEAANILLGLPQVYSSHSFVAVPTDLNWKKVVKRKEHMPKDTTSTDVYYKSPLEKYLERKGHKDMTYPEYQVHVRKSKVDPLLDDQNDLQDEVYSYLEKRFVDVDRTRQLPIPTFYQYNPIGASSENYWHQKLLMKIPFDVISYQNIFSESNITKTFLEECAIRGLLDKEHEAKEFLKSAVKRGFSYSKLMKIAENFVDQEFLDEVTANEFLKEIAPCHVEIEENIRQNEFKDSDIPAPQAIEYVKSFTDSQTKTFDFIVQQINRDKNSPTARGGNQVLLIVTGNAGTGKSWLLKGLSRYFEENGIIFKKTAPTGSAAKLIGGTTLHHAFRIGFDLKSRLEIGTMESLDIDQTDVLIIDEFSMLERDLLFTVNKLLQTHCSSPDISQKIFGGRTVLMFGDPFQLPSIGRGIYSKDLLTRFNIAILKETKRQSDHQFINLLNNVRLGKPTKADEELLTERNFRSYGDLPIEVINNSMYLTPDVKTRELINNKHIRTHDGEAFVFKAKDYGPAGAPLTRAAKIYIAKNKSTLPPDEVVLKKGAKL